MDKYPLCTIMNVDGNKFRETEFENLLAKHGVINKLDHLYYLQFKYLNMLETHAPFTHHDVNQCILIDDLPNEEWRPITVHPDFDSKYSVSNLGRVKSLKRGRMLSPKITTDDYLDVHIRHSAHNLYPRIHRLVAEAWIPKTEEDIRLGRNQVNHIDGDKHNNFAPNLEWSTGKENIHHAYSNDLTSIPIFTEQDIENMVTDYENHMPLKYMLEKYHVAKADSLYNAIFRRSHSWIKNVRIPICRNDEFYQFRPTVNFSSPHDVLRVKTLLCSGVPCRAISELLDINVQSIVSISINQSFWNIHMDDYPDDVVELCAESSILYNL